MVATRSYYMACGHWMRYEAYVAGPEEGDFLYCAQCMRPTYYPYQMKRDVDLKPVLGEYRWKCVNSHCPVTRKFGQDKAGAIHDASKHVQRYPTHYLHVIAPNGFIVARFGYEPTTEDLFQASGMIRKAYDSVPF